MKPKNKIVTKGSRILACHLLALSLLASCSQDDALPRSAGANLPSLGLSTLQATDMPADKTVTRAAGTTAYPTSKFIGFFVKADATNGYTACNNRKGEYNTTRKLWLPTPDSIWLNNHDADIAVYAPYDAAHTTAATLNLTAALRPADGSKDIWCKRFAANNKSKGLAPVLEHVYSRFTISLSLDANYKGTAPVDSVSLTNADLYTTGTYKPFETTAYTYAGDAGIEFKLPSVINLTTAAPTGTIDLLLIPATLAGDIKLSLTVNKITFGVTLSKASLGNKLQAGKQYNANIKLKPTALEVTSVTIADWNDVTVSGDKEPVFIDGIDIGLEFNFSEGNVIYTGGTHIFAPEQGYYEGSGSYYRWNVLIPNNNDSDPHNSGVWNDAADPCRKVGDGKWYLPKIEQWELVKNGKSVWGTYKMKNGSTVNGMYFGTTGVPVESEQDKYLFMPAAGRKYVANLFDNGALGAYWSRSFGTDNADYFYFNSGGPTIYTDYCAVGLSIRCIRDK